MNEIVIVEPSFFSSFHCVGGACPDHCCKGWDISLDKVTVERYQQSDKIEIRNIASDNIISTKESEGNWGKIKLNNDGSCAFLDEERLCRVHKSLGEKALSTTCAIYPRTYASYKYEIRSNLTLSCPEATKLLLTTPDAMLYSERIKLSPQPIDAPDIMQEDRLLNLMCTNIMVHSGRNINEGFYTVLKLLMFREGAKKDASLTDNLLSYYESIISNIENGGIKHEIKRVSADYHFTSALLSQLQNFLTRNSEGRGASVLRRYTQRLSALHGNDPNSVDLPSHMQQLDIIWREKTIVWLEQYPHMLINYVQYRFYEDFFPLKNGRRPFANLALMLSELFLLKSLISATVETQGAPEEGDIVNIIYSYHSLIRHNKNAEDLLLREIAPLLSDGCHSLLPLCVQY